MVCNSEHNYNYTRFKFILFLIKMGLIVNAVSSSVQHSKIDSFNDIAPKLQNKSSNRAVEVFGNFKES